MRRQPSAVVGPRLPRARAPAAATASLALRTTMHPLANEGNDEKEGERRRTRVGGGSVEGSGRALGVRPRRGGIAAVGGWRGGGGGEIALHSKHRLLESLGEKKRTATPRRSRRQWSHHGETSDRESKRRVEQSGVRGSMSPKDRPQAKDETMRSPPQAMMRGAPDSCGSCAPSPPRTSPACRSHSTASTPAACRASRPA